MPKKVPGASSIAVGVCRCGDLVGFDLYDKHGEVFAHAHLDPESAANFAKKRWRDGEPHTDDLRKECADVIAYTIMLADALGMTADDLIATVAHKQQVFIEKMEARQRASDS